MRFRVAGFALLAVHLTAVWWLTLRPNAVPWVDATNLRPLETIRAEFAADPWGALRYVAESLAMLAPAGALLPLAGGRVVASTAGSFFRTVFVGAMLALGIELLKTGVSGQVANVDTLMLHTVGVAVAHLAVVPAVRGRLRRAHGREREGEPEQDESPAGEGSQGRTPRMTRVGIAP